ncbi:MAG TPA: ABC transporter permease [Verrucomicrobiae bacterium]|jgi:ABC-type transport system involved in multi-copper enzyme maturation permease subunit|nr:ABC transporter permease [Verrucomicrobiae bacterium]
MNVIRIAAITLREMSRRKLMITAIVLTVAVALATGLGFFALAHHTKGTHGAPITHLQVLAISAVMLTMIAYMFNLIFALGGAFVAAPTLAGDIESGLLLPLATRPVRRWEIVLGKFAGIAILLCVYAFFSGFVEFGIVRVITGYAPPHPAIALTYLCGVGITMLSLTLLLSSRMAAISSGVAAVVLYGVAWIAGIVGDIGATVHNASFADVGTVSELILPSDAFWRSAVYRLEPVSLILGMRGTVPFAVAAPPPPAMVAWAIGWIVVMVALACLSLSTRDL